MPIINPVIRVIKEPQAPTAPTEYPLPVSKVFKIVKSIILKTDCKTFIIIIGIDIVSRPLMIEPDNMSTFLFIQISFTFIFLNYYTI